MPGTELSYTSKVHDTPISTGFSAYYRIGAVSAGGIHKGKKLKKKSEHSRWAKIVMKQMYKVTIADSVTSKKLPNCLEKLPKIDFTSKMKDFDNLTKIA